MKNNLEYYYLLSKQYPTLQKVYTEIINLEAILNLPKPTEHFISDIHGEYEAFYHVLNNCSGVIKEKIDMYFKDSLDEEIKRDLATLIYYPEEKLKLLKQSGIDNTWYQDTLFQLLSITRRISYKYTRSRVKKILPKEFAYIIDELLHPVEDDNQIEYHSKIIETIISLQNGDAFIISLTALIKRLAVDRIHIVGDIYDRGNRADKILDLLINHGNIDIQLGNHDILYFGAFLGNKACIARVVCNCLHYDTLAMIENGYGISLNKLRELALNLNPDYERLNNTMYEIMMNCSLYEERMLLHHHPEYQMHLDFLPKLDLNYREIINDLTNQFIKSEKLKEHMEFIFNHSSIYLIYNDNLLFHGCIPSQEDGTFTSININGESYYGRSWLDYCQNKVINAFLNRDDDSIDFLWYLWGGEKSPLCGRKLKIIEKWYYGMNFNEKRDYYYKYYNDEIFVNKIFDEFNLDKNKAHIVNGHTPIKVKHGETPLKANGKVIVIDGGFCKAYQKETGIAGYTLISNSYGMRLKAHQSFCGIDEVLLMNGDIHSSTVLIEQFETRRFICNTNEGQKIIEQINDLRCLLKLYQNGDINYL